MNKINAELPHRTMSGIKIFLIIGVLLWVHALRPTPPIEKWDLKVFVSGSWEKLVVNLNTERQCRKEMFHYRTLGFPLECFKRFVK